MASNTNRINPLSLTVEPELNGGNSNIQTSTEHAHSSSFGDTSLFSGSTRPTSPECSPETSGKYLTAHWQSQRRPRPDVGNAEEPDMFLFDSNLLKRTADHEQQQYNTSHISSFNDFGAIDDMGFHMTFGWEGPAVPHQDAPETNEGDQINLEPSEQFSPYPNYGNHAGPSSNAINIFPSANEPALSYSSHQNHIFYPLPASSSAQPSISISHDTQEAVTRLSDHSVMSLDLPRSLPIEVASRVCKTYETKPSKGKTVPNRSRSNSLSTKANRPGGRTHKLSIEARYKYGEVRKMGACTNCRIRKCGVSRCSETLCF